MARDAGVSRDEAQAMKWFFEVANETSPVPAELRAVLAASALPNSR
jgi:hypothetical protein